MHDAIVVTKGERADITSSESFIAINCQQCGKQVTDAGQANVILSRDTKPGDKQSFEIVCLDCDRMRDREEHTSWMKLHEFIETLARALE
jgi:hypothetical protein